MIYFSDDKHTVTVWIIAGSLNAQKSPLNANVKNQTENLLFRLFSPGQFIIEAQSNVALAEIIFDKSKKIYEKEANATEIYIFWMTW
jgi:hypothetical protein